MRLDLFHTVVADHVVHQKLDRLLSLLQTVLQKENIVSQELSDLSAEVARSISVDESVLTLIAGLGARIQSISDQLAAAGVDVSTLVQLRSDLASETDKLVAAVAANTPAAPPAPPADPVPDPVPPVDPDPIV